MSYHLHAAYILETIHALAEFVPTIDVYDTKESLTLTMPDGKIYLINMFPHLQQVWLSCPFSGAYHFYRTEETVIWPFFDATQPVWRDTRTDEECLHVLYRLWHTHYADMMDHTPWPVYPRAVTE